MLWSTLVLAGPLPPTLVLDVDRPTWTTSNAFSGPVVLTWTERMSALDPTSTLTVYVDGQPTHTLSRFGTGVPRAVDLGRLHGRHTVTLSSRLAEPDRETCDPGDPWLRLDDLAFTSVDTVVPTPGELRGLLAGRSVLLQVDDDARRLAIGSWLRSWGASLDGDEVVVRLLPPPADSARGLAWRDGVLEVWGDPTFFVALRDEDVLERCAAWPCRLDDAPLRARTPRRETLADLGFPRGLQLRGRQRETLVFHAEGPLSSGRLVLPLRRANVPLASTSTLSVELEGVPLGTWSLDRVPLDGELVVDLPAWALEQDAWRLTFEARLQRTVEACEREEDAPWIHLAPSTRLVGRPADTTGIAAHAQALREASGASLCLEAPVHDEGVVLLHSLRPTGGWTLDCDAPDVLWTQDPDPALADEERWGAPDGDAVVADRSRWSVVAGDPLTIHVPARRATLRSVAWPRFRNTRIVSTPAGWSGIATLRSSPLPPEDALPTDEVVDRRLLDLLFGVLAILVGLLGAAWVWRSSGDRSEWTGTPGE